MARTVGIGIQSFREIIENNCFYIDKTDFIREWWESRDSVTLITRPKRFGKTLTMSMTEQFFSVEYAGRGDLFEGLSIWKEEAYRRLQGTYPVISLTFANVKETNYRDTKTRICQLITDLYSKHYFLLDSGLLTVEERNFFLEVRPDMPEVVATIALYKMSDFLFRYYGKKVIILLDEYDLCPMRLRLLHQLLQLGGRRFLPVHFDAKLMQTKFGCQIGQRRMVNDESTALYGSQPLLEHGLHAIDSCREAVVIRPIIVGVLLVQLDERLQSVPGNHARPLDGAPDMRVDTPVRMFVRAVFMLRFLEEGHVVRQVVKFQLRIVFRNLLHPCLFKTDGSDAEVGNTLPDFHHLPGCRVVRFRTLPGGDNRPHHETVACNLLRKEALRLDGHHHHLFLRPLSAAGHEQP